jgi:hypothetical protein
VRIPVCCGHWNRHRFDVDPDPIFHFDADPDPDSDLYPDPTSSDTQVRKSGSFGFFYPQQCQFKLFYLS